LVGIAATHALGQPAAQGSGPTRIKIAAGTVSAEDTRAGLLGPWEPDAERGPGVPVGANQMIFLADGLYINPFQQIALIGVWSATANVLTSTPFDVRQLATGAPVPDFRQTFAMIGWDRPTVTPLTWLTPDRFRETPGQPGKRRAESVHDIAAAHRAAVVGLLRGTWSRPGGATVVFEVDGTFREQTARGVSTGTYDVEGRTGLLWRSNTGTDAVSRTARLFETGSRVSSRLLWTGRDSVAVDGEQWTRRVSAPVPPASTAARGYLGVGTPSTGAPVAAVLDDSPAASLGLRPGDVIVRLDGTVVQNAQALDAALRARQPGSRVEIQVTREGTQSTLAAVLAADPNGRGTLGVGLAFTGAVVTQVRPGSPAERVGLRVGDFIGFINGRLIESSEDLVRTVQSLVPGTEAVIRVSRRNEGSINFRVTVGSAPQ